MNKESISIKNPLILIMAGGLGKRMMSNIPKVLHLLKGKPLIVHVIETALKLSPQKIGIIVGKYKDIIEETILKYINDISLIEYIYQPDPLGTGNAIMCSKDFLLKYLNDTRVIILSGDVPLIKTSTLLDLNNKIYYDQNHIIEACILVNSLENPSGYGRIVIKEDNFIKIVEEKDSNETEKMIKLVNSGIYSFTCKTLIENINKINSNNNQNEYYLTDIFNYIDKKYIRLVYLEDNYEVLGVNTPEQLQELEKL